MFTRHHLTMSKQSSQGIDPHEIFRETFNSPSETRRNVNTVTAVTQSKNKGVFDGSTSIIDLGAPSMLGALTIVTKFNATGWGEGGYGRILDNGNFELWIANSDVSIRSDGLTAAKASGSIVLGEDVTVTITRDSTGANTNIYINGALSGSANQDSGTPAIGSTSLSLGNRAAADRAFDGSIDFIKILDVEWNAKEVELDYKGALYTDNKEGLLGHWKLCREHSNESTFYDLSGNEKDGVKANTPTFSYNQHGEKGKSVYFAGNGNKIVIGDLGLAKSFLVWCRHSTSTPKEILGVTNAGVVVRATADTGVTTGGAGWSSPSYYVDGLRDGITAANNGQWRMLVVTQSTPIATTGFRISNPRSSDYVGRISEVRVYDRELTPTEIRMMHKMNRGNE